MNELDKTAKEDEKKIQEMKDRGDYYDDNSILEDEQVERDLVDMVKSGFSKELFVMSVTNLLGDNWKKDGREILLQEAPELMGKFNSYVD